MNIYIFFINKNLRELRILCMYFKTVQIMFGTEKLVENNEYVQQGSDSTFDSQQRLYLGVVQKLRRQDEVGRWSKIASFCPRLG